MRYETTVLPELPSVRAKPAAFAAVASSGYSGAARRSGLLVASALLLALRVEASSPVDGRSCIAGLSNDHHFDVSQAVFLGQAVEQQTVANGDGTEIETTFVVEAQWKGERSERPTVRTCGGDGMVCSDTFTFEPGQRYVVFAWGQLLRTSSCSLTATREAGEAVLAWLRERQFH